MKKIILFYLIILNQFYSFGFDHSVSVNRDVFKNLKFNFSVVNIMDGRLNKEKPVGYSFDILNNKRETIGNDTICKELDGLFKNNSSSFETSNQFILVLNQLNYKETEYDVHYFDITLALDYYKIAGNKCVLFYRQYYNYFDVAGFDRVKKINNHFSATLTQAFREFEHQLEKFKNISSEITDTNYLAVSLKTKPQQEINNQNWKEGLYFNIKELYLNQPGYTLEYSISDTSNLGKETIALKSKVCLLNEVYAIALNKKLYINIGNGFYTNAGIDENGNLSIIVEINRIKNPKSKTPVEEMASWVMIGRLAPMIQYGMVKAVASNNKKSKDKMTLRVDFETGQWSSWGIGITR